ncbi:YveK family protein [Tepidibacter formicigenes]|jgi:capsular polysaccharide biosynthesis protein|uniref:Capsular polysaccharide biosynthesis protein n=1 Tax=Tepidibacter formicigenes DSM 15518 TaxID=1123349 RepID=A0A1M6TIT9_9FIRM|nr:Wzz/FepE/Etk N-terminal domain-containing protein [Tepidibacter formicigenes]SHK56844.1 Capsular polysaccharide biosynthesis protein [Tepidibacter formicigenes DSM 15518]
MEETIELRAYFDIIRKRIWILALITVISVLTSAVVSFFVLDPVYETSTTLMVNKAKNDESSIINYQDVILNQKLVLTYGEIVKSRTVLEKVIKGLNLNMKYEELKEKITVSPVKDTEIMNIKVQDTDAKKAKKIANKIPQVFTQEVIRITKADSVQVIDYAKVPENPIKPKPMLNIIVAGVLGVMIGLFIIFLIEYLDNTVKTPQDIEKHLELPVIGVIPVFPEEDK